MGCLGHVWLYTLKGAAVIRKECFTDMFKNSTLFYFVILIWIFLVVVNIIFYGLLLLSIVKLKDHTTQEFYKNIFMQVICGLFTFTALANLPVRLKRFHFLWIEGRMKGLIVRRPTAVLEDESIYVFDHLHWCTRQWIIQGLLWNCIFQLINQGMRCVYYDWESASEYPGVILVNVFFPLSFLMALMASILQAIAEDRFKQQHKIVTETNWLRELWHKLWKVQTEGYLVLTDDCEDRVNLPAGLVKQIDNLKERRIIPPNAIADIESSASATGINRAVICPELLPRESSISAGGSIQERHENSRTLKLLDF